MSCRECKKLDCSQKVHSVREKNEHNYHQALS